MVQTIPAQKVTLLDLESQFNLERNSEPKFFREWQEDLPELNELDQQILDEVRTDYLHLSKLPILEPIVKMVILGPLLRRACFYRSPFYITAEKEVEIVSEDQGTIIRGRLDLLAFTPEFWVTVIESKRTQFSLEAGVPQALAYMLGSPNQNKPTLGFVSNGPDFTFLKLVKENHPQYGRCLRRALPTRHFYIDTDGDLYMVLRILKKLSLLVSS